MLASETAEKPRVKTSQGPNERVTQPAPAQPPAPDAQPPAPDALPPELMSDEMHRAAAERSAPWQVRHASRIRLAALVGITGGLAGLALYGWNTLRPTELDKLQITLPARTSAGFVEPAAVQPPPAVAPTATVPAATVPTATVPTPTVPTKVQPVLPPQTASAPAKVQPAAPARIASVPTKVQPASVPRPRLEAAIPVAPSGNRTPVTHTRRADAATPAAGVVAAPAAAPSPSKAAPNPNCAEGVAALGLCK